MDLQQTKYELNDGVALVTLNRPDHLNAFTPVMGRELLEIYAEAGRDDQVRAVVVTGAGRAFCAGADLSRGSDTWNYARRAEPDPGISRHRDMGGKVSLAAYDCPKPVIAAMNGHAVGIGLTMTLGMDIRIAAQEAKMGLVFTRRGVVPEACSSWFLPRLVGMGKAAELVLTGRVFRAAEEAGSGLFNQVLPQEMVLDKALTLAREIVENTSPVMVALAKAMLWHGLSEPDPRAAHLVDSRLFYWAGRQADSAEGVQSFLEKRPPQFPLRPSQDMPDFYPWWRETKD
ncbi:MAG: enoyl-CoA hydratase/isomerase family protein [Deltaproteobacteria bacterium]|nr:enoyl-CoA hydratase/isomerase family protein [Deltaproteobacteria bacterium]